ncbi:MAG TPA: GAF domain-containing protein [Epsilonproteobacteria bacterium]|nr:GAF domain-containing protein [Campylobacterota bacterium]
MGNEKTYRDLIDFGNRLLITSNLEEGLPLISEYLREITNAMRCSIFVHNKSNDTLWTVLATGIGKIEISSHEGIVGHVFQTEKYLIENDVETNPYFLKSVDRESGYKTINMLVCPIYNSRKELIGVLQLINKLDGFKEDDMKFLTLFTNLISSFIELEPYYPRLK